MEVKNTLIDNSSEILSMKRVINDCLSKENLKMVSIATGYWDLLGTELIVDKLEEFLQKEDTRLRLLIGKDPYIYPHQLKELPAGSRYPDDFIKADIHKLEVKEEHLRVVKLLMDYCTDTDHPKIEIRVWRQNNEGDTQFMHSKCYIFEGNETSDLGIGIVGSSNFTQKGLLPCQGNVELNQVETEPAIVRNDRYYENRKTHRQWFDEKWAVSEPWNKTFLVKILKTSPLGKAIIEIEEQKKDISRSTIEFTPYEQYIKLLQFQFGDLVDKNLSEQLESYLPPKVHKLDYQMDAVKRCISIMHEHGGFMLADVVGLGKTIVGTLIIKRFLSVPEDDGRARKVLVITPPAIQRGWIKTVDSFDKNSDDKIKPCIDFITTGRIANIGNDENFDDDEDTGDFGESLTDTNYGLIIIDESHKFRNSDTIMYRELDDLISKIGAETGSFPYVGLLSATPQNNRPNDLKNQIYLFERNHKESTLKKAESGNIEKFFADIKREYDSLIQNKDSLEKKELDRRLLLLSKKMRDCVLSDILERRTRTDVKLYYKEDIESQGLIFPKVNGPFSLKYIMDDELARLFADSIRFIDPTPEEKSTTDEYLHYYRYRAIEYFVDDNNKKKHAGRGDRGVKDISDQLAKIMQILLVKRLESSFAAFRQSLLNLRKYTENMKQMWENNTIFICPQIDVNKEFDTEAKSKRRSHKVTFDDCVNDIRAKIKKLTDEGRNQLGQNAEYTRDDFKEEYIKLLEKDLQLVTEIYDRWARNTEDPKFDAFKESLKPVLFNPETNTSGKLVIFTEAIDTAESLARSVKAKGYRALLVTSDNRDELEPIIEENFDANYEGDWKHDYDVIITTEVLAEGVNLHRANVILNYDTPWNSTRLMQRIGRVNRIGSTHENIYVYNFMPSAEGDEQINLVRKAHTKLQSFHILFGEDSKIFSDDETVVHYVIKKAIDGEESPMEKYVYELKKYKEAHPDRYLAILTAETDWQITSAQTGNAYFLVKAPRSARLPIRITNEDNSLKSKIISMSEMLEEARPAENAVAVEHPENWSKMLAEAAKTYNQYFVRINKSRAGDKQSKAMDIIANLYSKKDLSDNAKLLLKKAMKLVRAGSIDIIKKMLAIDDEIKNKEAVLFALTPQDIEEILEREISKLVANVEKRQGEAKIIMGTIN